MTNVDSSGGIYTFCPTRWRVHGGAIKSILENYDVLNQLWEECLEERSEPDVKLVSRHVCHITICRLGWSFVRGFYALLITWARLCRNSHYLMQKHRSLPKLINVALKRFRTDEVFELFFQLIECLSDKVGADGPTLPRKRRHQNATKLVKEKVTVSDHYCQLYFEELYWPRHVWIQQPLWSAWLYHLPEFRVTTSKSCNQRRLLFWVHKSYGSDIDNSVLIMYMYITVNIYDKICYWISCWQDHHSSRHSLLTESLWGTAYFLQSSVHHCSSLPTSYMYLLQMPSVKVFFFCETIKELFRKHYRPSKVKPSHAAHYLQRPAWWSRSQSDSQWICSRKWTLSVCIWRLYCLN